MTAKLFIPEKIKVGFQKRTDTYTGQLAYIIYYDEKGVLKKEASWQGWRDKSIPDVEILNTPQNGFIFNKNIQRNAYHFGSGRSMMRVYDPRNFEFEIDMDNLSCILMNTDVSKSEINENCVFGWSGKDLVLIPVNSQEYKEATEYTALQKTGISTKELVKGFSYKKKKEDGICIYMGYIEYFDSSYEPYETRNPYGGSYTNYRKIMKNKGKKHIFYVNGKYNEEFSPLTISTLSGCISDEVDQNYADLFIRLEKEMESRKAKVKKELK